MAKRIRIALIAAAMTLLLAMGAAAVNVHAAAGAGAAGGDTKDTEPTLTKEVTIPEGVTVDTGVTFNVKQVTKSTDGKTAMNADGTEQPEVVADYTISISASDINKATLTGGKKTISGVELDLAAKTKKLGVYTFEISEVDPSTTDSNWAKPADTKYYVHVYVEKNGTHSYLVTKENTVTTDKDGKVKFTGDKNGAITFANTYSKDTKATLTKDVHGDTYVKDDQQYTFDVTFSQGVDGITVTGATKSEKKDDNTLTVTLTKSQTATFTGLKAGTTMNVVETGNYANLQSTKYTFTRSTNTDQQATTVVNAQDSFGGAKTLYDKTNDVTVANTFKPNTITGVITQIAPFIAMVAIAGGAVALYLVSRKRREA